MGGLLPRRHCELPAKSVRPAGDGRQWSGWGASRQGDGPVSWLKRGEELTEMLLYIGGDRRWGRDGGKAE
jgi:hypothetical protein